MGIETHIRTLTHIEEMGINRYNFLLPPSVVECFASMGSSLTELEIRVSPTTLRIIASMLAALPEFKCLVLGGTGITDDVGWTSLLPGISFFEYRNLLVSHSHLDQHDSPGPPDWVPPSA